MSDARCAATTRTSEPVEADGTTLYRARFVGFKTKTAAWDACKTLKRNKFNCYAVYQ
ncbi:MAG: SPOR domain-containing protein [Alphaproteobacteria bacterium]|nr:SPOR domain-containing protein [Alphaproteobacteria bacterium]